MELRLILNMIIISISLSIDALGIGVSYQLKKVQIKWIAKIIIAIMSMLIMYLSLQVGNILLAFFPEDVMKIIGISILVLIGIGFIRNSLFGSEEAVYDFDHSENIDWKEALVLGIALSIDNLSAGVAISSIGLSNLYIPIMVGLMQVTFLHLGGMLVAKNPMFKRTNGKICGVLSGILLIVIAVVRGIAG